MGARTGRRALRALSCAGSRREDPIAQRPRRRPLPAQTEPSQKEPTAGPPEARLLLLRSARGALRDKVRPENGSAHRPQSPTRPFLRRLAPRRPHSSAATPPDAPGTNRTIAKRTNRRPARGAAASPSFGARRAKG